MKFEIIDRYVYAVVNKLPVKQRADIEKEIRSLIEDMMEKYSNEDSEIKQAEKALEELGDPNLLADNYIEKKRYLIGPKNFNEYMYVMKIVLVAVFFGISIAFAIDEIFVNDNHIPSIIGNYFGLIFSALFQAVAWVTIIFAIADYKGVSLSQSAKSGHQWNLKDLKPIPNKKIIISPLEAIFGIGFSSIFLMILYFSPQIIAAYRFGDNGVNTVIPFFNTDVIHDYRIIIIGIFIVTIAKEAVKLIYGRWNKQLAIISSILSIVSTVLFYFIISDKNIYNPNFIPGVSKMTDFQINIGIDQFLSGFISLLIIITFVEVVSNLYKGFVQGR